MVRENNEDSAYAGPRLLALADGMGGHAAGEIASQFVVAALARLDEDEPGQNLTAALTRALTVGNEAIAAHVEAHPETEGMGCTATALLFDGRRMGLIHVGDSRAYLLRDGTLSQITKDDTFVQSLVDRGELSADEAHTHPRRSLILKALTGEPVEPTAVIREARVGDRYLLCSDGLSDPVSTETIAETLSTGTVEEAADRLVQLALRSGGPDNITVVLADVVDSPRDAPVVPVVVGAASGDEPGQIDPAADPYSDTAAGKAAAFSRAQVACLASDGDLTMHSPDAIPTGCDVFTLGDLREPARETVRAGMPSGSLAEATAQVSRLAQDNLLPVCEPEPRDPDRDGRTSPSSPSSPTGPAPVPGETCRAVS